MSEKLYKVKPLEWPQGGKVSEIKYGGHTAAELAKLEAAATPGPWVGDRYDSTVKYAILSGGYRVYNVNCDPPDDASYVTYWRRGYEFDDGLPQRATRPADQD